MTRSEKAALVVMTVLVMFLLIGLTVAWTASTGASLGVLVFFAILTTVLGLVAALVAERTAKARKLQGTPAEPLPWRLMRRPQWILLTVGLASISALTASISGIRVLAAEPAGLTVIAGSPSPVPVLPTMVVVPEPSPTPTASSSPTGSPSPSVGSSPSSPVSSESPSGTRVYLDSLNTVNGSMSATAVTMSGVRYARSVDKYCYTVTSTTAEWNVAGLRTFTATLGVPDDAKNAFGGVIEMLFYDQDGRQLGERTEVSLGHPKTVTIDITGVVRLRFACAGRDAKTNKVREFVGAMGDAVLIR